MKFSRLSSYVLSRSILLSVLFGGFTLSNCLARQNIRDAFFDVYPAAVGTVIETVPSQVNHCGMCHYDFTGGGTRNPYGARLEEELPLFPSNPNGRRQAVTAIETGDWDADGFDSIDEITDVTNFDNTPTFPGLRPALIVNVSNVDVTEIQSYLVPIAGADETPPEVTVLSPNGGETLTANGETTIEWTATDAGGVAAIDMYLSEDNGVSFRLLAKGLDNSGSILWYLPNRPTATAILRIVATDNFFNTGQDDSDSVFTIASPTGGIVDSTLRDFDLPGSQPFEAGVLNDPTGCSVCHGEYDPDTEPFYNWQGSMMSQASRDPLFEACMVIANQDAPDSGDLCLRCHLPRGWLQGRSIPTDGSQMLATDMSGVSCDLCHRLVDPVPDAENPVQDTDILNNLSFPPTEFGNGMFVVDPTGARRGPFTNANSGHPVLVSPFHREAALCGTCHDVSNPAFENDGFGNFRPNDMDTQATSFSAHTLMPIERTYSEWFYSDYNTPTGVYAPEFGGNKNFVATCQDCHMRDVTGQGCNFGNPPIRDDLPLHDMTGGSTWMTGLLRILYPGEVNDAALQDGILRARTMLQLAADVTVTQESDEIKVQIVNRTGHKLPTGYPEGRRMWINVKFYNEAQELIAESGAYNFTTGELSYDEDAKIYEAKPGLDEITAPLVGVDEGPSFHFVLNNKIFKDNRIPPQGFTNTNFELFGGLPVGHSYDDGQFWDYTEYDIPPGADSVEVTLYYQSTSKEYIEFLRDENATNNVGLDLFNYWNDYNKCPPEEMAQVQIDITPLPGDFDGNFEVNLADLAFFFTHWLETGCDDTAGDTSDWCYGCDFDQSGKVNLTDYAIWVNYWEQANQD